jgi:hypothetical protein
MTTKTKTYANFTAGHYGSLDPSKAPEGSFFGINALVYRDGTVGPRAGFKALSFGRTPTARVYGFAHMENINWSLVYVEGTAVYRVKPPQAAGYPSALLLGNIGTRPTEHQMSLYDASLTDGGGYLHVPEEKSYRITDLRDNPGATFTALAAATNTKGAGALHGARLYIIPEAVQSNKVFYSNALDDATWPAANFFNVGYAANLTFIEGQRGHLTIGTGDGQWYVLSGTPGADAVLRRIVGAKTQPGILVAPCGVVGGDDVLYYLQPRGAIPATFDGVKVEELSHLGMAQPTSDYGKSTLIDQPQVHDLVKAFLIDAQSPAFYLKTGNGRMMARIHDAWVRQDFNVALDRDWAADGRGRVYAFSQWTGAAPQSMYVADWGLERPGFVSDTHASPGDNTTNSLEASVELPQHWTADGTDVVVQQVIVDMFVWNTGSPVDNRLDVTVEHYGRRGVDAATAATQTWTVPGAGYSTDTRGTSVRRVFDFGTATPGAGFQVKFPVVRGVGIRSVQVRYLDQSGTPRV